MKTRPAKANAAPPRRSFMEWLYAGLPSCHRALRLLEAGRERDLSALERLQLRYDSRLCPFCSCASSKVASARARMLEARGRRPD